MKTISKMKINLINIMKMMMMMKALKIYQEVAPKFQITMTIIQIKVKIKTYRAANPAFIKLFLIIFKMDI